MNSVLMDWSANCGNTKGRIVAVLYRIARLRQKSLLIKIALTPYYMIYKIAVEWVMGIELPLISQVGAGLQIYHGHALVVSEGVKIGSNCILRQSTTIGNKGGRSGDILYPEIGNNVNIGANTCIIGSILIGDGATIGAGSVVTKSILPNTTVVGNPAKALSKLN